MGIFAFLDQSRAQLWATWGWPSLALSLVILVAIFFVSRIVYNLHFHPLAKFPGPWYAAVSDLFYARNLISGHGVQTMRALHEKYGEVVRVAPQELSFSSATAWRDIYTVRKSGNIFTKDPKFFISDDKLRAQHIVNVINVEEHAKARKILSHAFSPKALLEQEDIILKYANMFMVAIKEESSNGPMDLTDCYNWVTFDILGELAFGEPFGSVEQRKTHEWIVTVLKMVKFIAYDSAIYRVSPTLEKMLERLIPADVIQGAVNHVTRSKDKILARLNRGEGERKDFCSYIFQIKEEMSLTDWNMAAYSNVLILAGSETSGTVLSALTYFLCRTPRVYEKLKHEVRSRYKSSCEITSVSATFPYLTAVINEALRIYPPVPFGAPRVVPKGGETVDGKFVPGGTTVSVQSWASTHNVKNFKDPDSFIPERWLDPEGADNLSASNPFSIGPRSCIGINMAWMELRIIIAKMVFLFDYELVDDKLDLVRDSPTYILFDKPKLWTKITPRDVT